MKKRSLLIGFLAVVAIVMTSCFTPEPEVVFLEADLLGLWQEKGTEAFVRFTDEQDETGEYKYGREWDESEEMEEEYLQPYGNGWFKYKLVQNDLKEIHLMDKGDYYKAYFHLRLRSPLLLLHSSFQHLRCESALQTPPVLQYS